jgi:hypothetical protein
MADNKGVWYKSKRGWLSAMTGVVYFVLDHWGRAQTAKDIYAFAVGPARQFFPLFSPYVPLALFAVAIMFFEMERRKRATKTNGELATDVEPKLKIQSALYGIGNSSDIHIADELNMKRREGLVLAVNNNLVNRDPSPGTFKHLVVKYSWDAGAPQTISIPEHGWLMLPQDPQIQVLGNEIERLMKAQREIPDKEAFNAIPCESIRHKTFEGGTVELDGKFFFDCKFLGTKLVYQGVAPTNLVKCDVGGTLRIQTDNAAIHTYSRLVDTLTGHPSVRAFKTTVLDKDGKEIEKGGRKLLPKEPFIDILTPMNHAEVGLYREVRGSVYPPNSEIQVLVFAGDNMWYDQGPVQVDGSSWSKRCKFGLDKPNFGGDYKIIALFGKRVRDSRVYALPTDTSRSEEIKVRRTHDGGMSTRVPD